MTRRATLRAAAVLGLALGTQLVGLRALSAALAVEVELVNTALLLFATTALGQVWALRQHLTRSRWASFSAAVIPVVAAAVFLSPRLARGAPGDALLTLSVCAALAAPIERAWSEWVVGARPVVWARALCWAAPAAAVSLACLAVAPVALVEVTVAACLAVASLVAGFVTLRAARSEREALAYATLVERLEVAPDALHIPEAPEVSDPWLRELDRSLRNRSEELAITAREARQAERAIDEARQVRSQFMASMSHELRSPLNSIVGFAQILEDGIDGELSDGQRESVVMVRRSAEQLIALLTDTLDLARIEAGKLRLRRQWTPSVEILTEAVRRGREIVEGREVEIEAELQPGLPPVYADPARIVQAVVALVRHAARSMTRSSVRLRARTALGPPGPAQQLRLEFYDAVGALPRAEVERIFEAFREIAAPSGRRVGGLGMALSLSRELVRLHGGEVWADSVPGAGTVLCIALPLDEPEPTP